jgi:putative DNA primase/helicase
MLSLRSIASILGGEVNGSSVICPGPGHSKHDRSLSVKLSPRGDGFIVHSFSGQDWKECKEYVRNKLGIKESHKERIGHPKSLPSLTALDLEQSRYAKARELWASARTDELRQHLRETYPRLFKDESAWEEAFRIARSPR